MVAIDVVGVITAQIHFNPPDNLPITYKAVFVHKDLSEIRFLPSSYPLVQLFIGRSIYAVPARVRKLAAERTKDSDFF